MAIYDINDSVVFSVAITNEDGDLATPDTLTLTLTDPSGTTTTPTPTNTTTGTYTYTHVVDQAGQWTASWASENPDAAYVEVANVRPATENMLISLDEGRRHLNLVSTNSDEELRETIHVATHLIERLVGPVLPTSRTERHDGYRHVIPLDERVYAVTTVVEHPGTTVEAADGDNRGYRVDGDRGLVLLSGETPVRWSRRVVVTYQAGIGDPPPPVIRQACRELVRHLWNTQRGPVAPRTMESEGFFPGLSFTLPRRVVELLDEYVTPGVR